MDDTFKPVSGVNPKLYSPYLFEDHLWSGPAPRPDLLELSQRCVKIGDQYWIRQAGGTLWSMFKNELDATREAESKWMHGQLSDGTQVTAELIKTFFSGSEESTRTIANKVIATKTKVGSCPHLHGRMVIPYGPRFITYKEKHYLNAFQDESIRADAGHVAFGKQLLLLIYRSLCAGPALEGANGDMAKEADMLLEQVVINTYTQLEFRFVMNWLAAVMQQPGINLQTNLWLCGNLQGIGKGTLASVMRTILGASLVGSLDQQEIEAGYSDHLFGHSLIISNEFDATGAWSGKRWNKWIKSHTCEDELPLRGRYVGSWDSLHIGNFWFNTNDEDPVFQDETDRRNFMVKTTDDPFWKEFASILKAKILESNMAEAAAGLAWVLAQVQLDLTLIMTAPLTALKAENKAVRLPPVEEWITQASHITREKQVAAEDLYFEYTNWHQGNCPGKVCLSLPYWGRGMKALAKRGVEPGRDKRGSRYLVPKELGEIVTTGSRDKAGDLLGTIAKTKYDVAIDDVLVKVDDPEPPLTKWQQLQKAIREEEHDGKPKVFSFTKD
jgi:hypothetical protein